MYFFFLITPSIRYWYHPSRRKSQFFIGATLWPCLNNGLHHWRTVHIDGLNKKIIISPTSVKMGLRTLAPPRGGTSLSWPLTTTAPQKNEKKTFATILSPAYWTIVLVIFNVPKLSTILESLTHHSLGKITHFALQTTSIRCWCHQ